MAVKLYHDAEQRLLLLTFDGELRDADLSEAYRRAAAFQRRVRVQRGILDGRGVDKFSISAERVKRMAIEPPMFDASLHRCIVVGQDFIYGMARMYQMLGGESREHLHVVRTIEEAYAKLGVKAPEKLEMV